MLWLGGFHGVSVELAASCAALPLAACCPTDATAHVACLFWQDVDDINRLLAVSQPPDGGLQLRRRKQILLEGLAASLQLSDAAGTHAAALLRQLSRGFLLRTARLMVHF